MAKIDCPRGSIVALNPPGSQRLYLWTSIGTPALLFSSLNSSVNVQNLLAKVNCSANISTISSSIYSNLVQAPLYSFALFLSSIVEFDDSFGSAQYGGASLSSIQLSSSQWNQSLSDESSTTFTTNDGVVQLIITQHGDTGRDSYNPFLAFNEQSASVSLQISNYYYNGSSSKLAAQLVIACSNADLALTSATSIDDEYTPTVFVRDEIRAGGQGFVFWKPVAFGSLDRQTSNDTFAMPTDLSPSLPISTLAGSVAAAFFPPSSTQIRQTFVSFGEKKDDTFNFNYIAWSFIVGLGQPVEESFSSTLLLTIFITNGLPLLAFIFGGGYLGYKKWCARPADYQPLHIQ